MSFIKRVRISDMIGDAIMESHFWAVDRNVASTYIEDVVEGVNAYGRSLVIKEALVAFNCWFDPDLNIDEDMNNGAVSFDYDWVEYGTAEHIIFRSTINNGYLSQVRLAAA